MWLHRCNSGVNNARLEQTAPPLTPTPPTEMLAVSSENKNAATDAERLRHSICLLSSLNQFFFLFNLQIKKKPRPPLPNANVSASNYPCRAAGQSCVRRLGGRWTVTCDRKRPSSMRGCRRSQPRDRLLGGGAHLKKARRKGRDN